MLRDVDESVVQNLFDVLLHLDSSVVRALNLVPLLFFHFIGLSTLRFLLIFEDCNQLVTIGRTQLFAEHALEGRGGLCKVRVEIERILL